VHSRYDLERYRLSFIIEKLKKITFGDIHERIVTFKF